MFNLLCDSPIIPFTVDKPIDAEHFAGAASGSTYVVATWIMKVVDWLLGIFGLDNNKTIVTILYAAVVLVVALVVGYIAKWIILTIVRQVSKRWSNDTYQALTSANFFTKVCRTIPALVFLILIEFSLSSKNALASILTRVTLIYIIFLVTIALSTLVSAIWLHIDNRENKKKLPLKGLAQLVKVILWIITAIIIAVIVITELMTRVCIGKIPYTQLMLLCHSCSRSEYAFEPSRFPKILIAHP